MSRLALVSVFAILDVAVTVGCGGGGNGGSGGGGGSIGGSAAGTNGGAGTTGHGGNAGNAGGAGTTGSAGTAGAGGRGNSGGAAGTAGDTGRGGSGGTAGTGGTAGNAGRGGSAGGPAGWTLTWSDDFDGPADQGPDTTKWAFDIGTGSGGWGNNELEYYTSRPTNVATDGQGHLVITLRAESHMGSAYTSARLKTLGKFTQTYGRFEARIKIPRGRGVWPAFWMLGADINTNTWPSCGEIDILENNGRDLAVNQGSLHGPGYSGGNPLTAKYTLPAGALSDDFHVYAVEWETNVVRFYVDGNLYQTRRNTDVPSGGRWVYDHPFFMLLNVAIGGAFPGNPDASTVLPQTMTVDHVRVYAR